MLFSVLFVQPIENIGIIAIGINMEDECMFVDFIICECFKSVRIYPFQTQILLRLKELSEYC